MAKDVSLIRIKADTNDYERSIKHAQKTWDDFTKGLGVNVGKLTGVAATIGAVTGALKVAKDAFFKNEQQLDEWGRTVKSAESLYSGFLNALNTGNISGYLQNMNNIVNAARAAYDAMDALGTFNAFNQINQAKAQTDLTNAIADFREGTGSKDAVRSAADALKNELLQRQKYEQEAYDAAVANLAAQRGVSASDLMKAMSGSYGNYQTLKNVMPTGSKTVFQSNGQFGGTTSYNVAVPANEAERLGEALRQLNDTELQSLQALGAAAQRTANEIANTDKQVARVLRGNTGGSGGSGSGGKLTNKESYVPAIGSIDEMRAKVKELQDDFNKTADQSIRGNLLVAIDEAQKHLDFISGKGLKPIQSTGYTMKVQVDSTESLEQLEGIKGYKFDPVTLTVTADTKEALEKLKELKDVLVDTSSMTHSFAPTGSLTSKLGVGVDTAKELNKIQIPSSYAKSNDNKEMVADMKSVTSSVSGILSGVTRMGIELPEELSAVFGVMQGISSILTSILTITTLINAQQTGESVLGGVLGLIGGIFGFSHGGIVKAANGMLVPGNSFSGDNLRMPIMGGNGWVGINSGELILSRSQQDSIAAQLQDGGGINIQVYGRIQGDDIILAADRTGQHRGYGQLMFGKNL